MSTSKFKVFAQRRPDKHYIYNYILSVKKRMERSTKRI